VHPGGPLGQPDLRVLSIGSSQDSPFDCGRPTGIAVEVSNMGMAPAGPFSLVLEGDGLEDCRWRFDGLQPGERTERICPVVVLDTVVTATVDLENLVPESDEENNVLVRTVNVVVLPTCTPRPTP
jgi:subtilase family serine protease